MDICKGCPSISEEDLRAARKELKTYVDITDEDLMKIFVLAIRHARDRHATMIPVGSVMSSTVFSVSAGTDVRKAAGLLAINHISGMPVVDEENRVIGVVSEADIAYQEGGKKKPSLFERIFSRNRQDRELLVRDVMSTPPVTTQQDADVTEVAAIFDMRRIKRLPVVDEEGKLVGIISRGDLIRDLGRKVSRRPGNEHDAR